MHSERDEEVEKRLEVKKKVLRKPFSKFSETFSYNIKKSWHVKTSAKAFVTDNFQSFNLTPVGRLVPN